MTGEVQIVNAQDQLALDTRHTIRAGARIQMYTRNTPPSRNQVWVLDPAGLLRCGHPDGDFVLDVAGDRAGPGAELTLSEVDGSRESQRWDHVDGRLVNRAAPALGLQVVPPGGKEAGVTLVAHADDPGQQWTLLPIDDPGTITEPEPYDD